MLKKQKKRILTSILFIAVLLSFLPFQHVTVEAKELQKIGITSTKEFWDTIVKLQKSRQTKSVRLIVKGKDSAEIKKEFKKNSADVNRTNFSEDPYAFTLYRYNDFYKLLLKHEKSPDNLLLYYSQGYNLYHVKSVAPDLEEFRIDLNYNLDQYKKLTKTINKVKKIVASWDLKNLTDYQRVAKVNDYICSHVTYDYTTFRTDFVDLTHEGGNPDSYTAYGALFNGKAVCNGYANLADMFLREMGYECASGLSPTHAWNEVKIAGKYYMLDVTFNDTSGSRTAYLLLGMKEVKQKHHPGRNCKFKNHAENRLPSSSKSKIKL